MYELVQLGDQAPPGRRLAPVRVGDAEQGRGHLGGAALDVFDVEPLPAASPLWDLENVLVSPHSASTLPSENEALVDLFVDNLRRFLNSEPLRNRYDATKGY